MLHFFALLLPPLSEVAEPRQSYPDMEEVNDSKLDVFQEELKLLPKSARVS